MPDADLDGAVLLDRAERLHVIRDEVLDQFRDAGAARRARDEVRFFLD
jgi:hypothetical protein